MPDSESGVVQERGAWGSKWEFLLTALGLAVGIGNVWRFPYLTYANGGGSFLIPYSIALVVIGLPMLFQEMAMGQYAREGCNKIFANIAPIFKGLAYAMLYIRFLMGQVYFMVLVSWSVYYLAAGFTKDLPWESCTEEWNTKDCYSIKFNDACDEGEIFWNFECSTKEDYCLFHGYEAGWREATDECVDGNGKATSLAQVLSDSSISSTEDYFNGKVLGLTKNKDGELYSWEDYGSIRWELVLCQLTGWILMTLINIKGVSSLGKAAYVLTVFPYVLLTVLLGYAVTLDGAGDGVDYYMSADWEKLSDSNIWLQACTQIVMSTGVSQGVHLVLASFAERGNRVYIDSTVVGVMNSITSLYAGFAVFSMTGFLAQQTNRPVESVVESGVTLAFITYPSAILEMDVPPLWSFLFFFMLINLAINGLAAGNQMIVTFILDENPRLRSKHKLVLLGVATFGFICGLPFTFNGGVHLFTLLDARVTVANVALAIGQVILFAWVYGMGNFYRDMETMNIFVPKWMRWFLNAVYILVIPGALTYCYVYSLVDLSTVAYGDYEYPDGVQTAGWFVIISPLIVIFFYAAWFVFNRKFQLGMSWGEFFQDGFKPTERWFRLREEVAGIGKDDDDTKSIGGSSTESSSSSSDEDDKSAKVNGGFN